MKKRIERIQKWLDRLKTACEKNRLDSAVQEADCLSAEVREARNHLWEMLEESQEQHKRTNLLHNFLSTGVKSTGIALIVVLVSTLPLAVESEKKVISQTAIPKDVSQIGKVTAAADSDYLYNKLSKKIGNSSVHKLPVENIGSLQTKVRPAEASVKHVAVPKEITDSERSNVTERNKDSVGAVQNTITNEELITLVQVGEKALRGNSPAIKLVENR
jgi:hypothetical protein